MGDILPIAFADSICLPDKKSVFLITISMLYVPGCSRGNVSILVQVKLYEKID